MGDKWYASRILERRRLNDASSEKETYHIALDLKESGIAYEVGDCLKIMPQNDPEMVNDILQNLGLGGSEVVYDKEGNEYGIEHFLLTKANVTKVTKKLAKAIVQTSDEQKEITELDEHDFLSLLKEYRPTLTAEQVASLLSPLLPRYYSIASSKSAVKEEAHLTVAAVGVASDYLCKQVELRQGKIEIAHHKSPHFGLPKASHTKPIIMVGPGTGIAPFIGFLQERVATDASPANWLFFGERSSTQDFYYREYLEGLREKGLLRLDTAFSRDGAEKIYVQHRMYEKRAALWEWLDRRGAYLFVCGDKKHMAKAVEETLLQILSEEGKMALPEAKAYLSDLRKQKRYLRDVY